MKQYSSLGPAIFDRLGNRCRKDLDTMFTRQKDPDPKPPFWGLSVFKKLRIRADTCDRFYVSGVEKLRFRKDPGTCARSLKEKRSGRNAEKTDNLVNDGASLNSGALQEQYWLIRLAIFQYHDHDLKDL